MLIVLDDVDHEDQLDALLPLKESIGSGSLVNLTTREGDPFPQEGFEDLVEDCIAVCNGLPLSLKVIGAQLYGKKSKDYWVSQVGKIRRILPKEIMQRLKVSYDALDRDEQEIFLDIACFFNGKRRSSAIAVWDGSGWSGLYSWEMLYNKCLVEVDQKERIRMHDHLGDL
ncbi:disease resistance protein Roq1 [Cryptomeria japonica]|uniref:disease resistance protein Roq1 n=1 Tax=Cryptomeria japonica TaxID=3369 RepID=UPI0027DA9060|nr:disease resistance protein Roq1 [Cryptomeria japonica]